MDEQREAASPVTIFYSYAHEDEPLREQLEKHLSTLRRQGVISDWHDRQIVPGTDWTHAIDTHLNTAAVILLLISPDFFASDYCYGIELQQAMERHNAKEARVIPIFLRPVDWRGTPFEQLQALPTGAKPITTWSNQDEAFVDVATGIRRAIKDLSHPSGSTLVSSLPHVWNIPYPRNPFFTGREDLLSRLSTQLRTGQVTALSQPQAVSGLGGIGKTQTAVEYTYRYRNEYQATLWIKADTHEVLLSDFVAIARLVNLPEKDAEDQRLVAAAVKRWLEISKEWLLIVDNADDLDMVKPFLPSTGSGHVLLTTRTQATGTIAQSIEIEKMDAAEGALFLLRRVKLLAPDAPLENVSKTDCDEAREIATMMDGLPLALDQAGAYIEETRCGLHGYLDRYQKRSSKLLKRRGSLGSDHPESVHTTFSLSFEKVQQAHRAAADLLRFCAFLHPDAIPEEILMKGAPDLGPLLQPLAADPIELDEAIGELLKYSLVHRDPHTETLSLHRLVQDVLKDEMDEETQRTWAERVVKAVNRLFPDGEYVIRSDYQRSLPHAQVCAAYIGRWNMMFIEAAQLLNRVGWYLRQYTQQAQAEMFITQALAISQHTLGPDHPNLAPILINLALLSDYYHQDYTQAEQYYQRAVMVREQALGPNHPDVATSLNSLALFYYYQGKYYRGKEKCLKYSLAESLFQRVLTIREQTLEPNHPEIATVLNDLGRLYFAQSEYKKAEQFCKRALTIREQTLEPNNPRIATTLDNLARTHRAQKEFDKAELLCKQALTIREQSLGPHHPGVAETLETLAKIYIAQGKKYETVEMYGEGELFSEHEKRYEEAELLYKRALTIRTQVLGPNHTSVDDCLENLVELYKAQGKYAEVELLYQEAVRNYEQILGPDHSSTNIARSKYARLLQKAKREHEQQEAKRRSGSWLSRLQKRREAESAMLDKPHTRKQEGSASETNMNHFP